jgi:nucleoside-diphosphate-sugar epimerase
MSVVLVTGAGGFIGRHVVAACHAQDDDVLEIRHRWSSREELDSLLAARDISRCIHLGWYSDPADYLTNAPENLRSLESSLELVEVLRGRRCEHLVVAGTCAEYAPADRPLREDSRIQPWSVYGAAKASLHLLLTSSFGAGLPALGWARLFNLTGPGENSRRLLPTAARALQAGEKMALSPGLQVRDYLDVRDVASALVHLSSTRSEGSYNVCSGEGVTLRVLLQLLAEACGSDRKLLDFGARGYTSHDSMLTVGDPAQLRNTGWRPGFDLPLTLADVAADTAITAARQAT